MPSQVSSEELGAAILQSVEHGSFPQSEHVASATVPSTALPKLLEVVGKAREDTKVLDSGSCLEFKLTYFF
jgi:centromere/kinetochore protein ZW10